MVDMGGAKGPGSFPSALPAAAGVGAATITRSPARVVERARTGDKAAFEVLVACWVEPAFRIALSILGNEADARDATQDAFLAAWRRLRQLRDPERFDGWLYQILVNSCRGLRRGRQRVAVREIQVSALGGDLEPVDDPPETADERASSLDAIERAWFRLTVAERTILALHHLEHRPVAEIAAMLRIPTGTAKSRLFHARRSLDQALEAERR
jgi:RNA polymerase sigma-70 factor (ECF subfamily)